MYVSNIIYNPIFRESLLLAAVVVLIVFCIDKSRQNKRTRHALYNCIYPLYGAAALMAVQLLRHAIGYTWLYVAVSAVLLILAVAGYCRYLKPQADIPYNKLFRAVGWIVLGVPFALLAFELLMVTPS